MYIEVGLLNVFVHMGLSFSKPLWTVNKIDISRSNGVYRFRVLGLWVGMEIT